MQGKPRRHREQKLKIKQDIQDKDRNKNLANLFQLNIFVISLKLVSLCLSGRVLTKIKNKETC